MFFSSLQYFELNNLPLIIKKIKSGSPNYSLLLTLLYGTAECKNEHFNKCNGNVQII